MTDAMDEQLKFLALIIESSDDAIIAGTAGGIVRTWNPAAEKLFGYSSEEMIGKSAALIVPEDQMAESTGNWIKVSSGERIPHWETFRVRKDGTTVAVSVSTSPIWEADGKIIGVCVIYRDITEQKEIESMTTDERVVESQRLAEHERMVELERFKQLSVGRELKMIKMKREIEDLRKLIPVESDSPDDEGE